MGLICSLTVIDTSLLSMGVNAKYTFNLGVMDVTPHAGIRYNHLDVDGFTVKFDAGYVTFPIGVTFDRDIATASGFNIRPALDLAVIPAAGDTKVRSRIVSSNIEMAARSEILDDVTFRVKPGVDVTRGNFVLGVNYGYLGASGARSHSLNASISYTF